MANELRDFRLGGAELPAREKARLKAVDEELAELSARFDDNVLDATNDWALYVADRNELAGVPDTVLAEARAAAEADGNAGWKLTLHMPCYLPVLSYADNRALRATLHRAYATRASDLGASPAWDNGPVIRRLLELRHEAALLLGYAHISPKSRWCRKWRRASTKCSDSCAISCAAPGRSPCATTRNSRPSPGPTSASPISRRGTSPMPRRSSRRSALRSPNRKFAAIFRSTRCSPGSSTWRETLYGISIRESRAPTWHEDVRFFDVNDASGTLIGQFYLDNYARPGKQGGAWQDDAINRRRAGTHLQHPVAFLTCNLSAATAGRPATFTHDEVITLFHEFGHGLHQLLTRVEVAGVSGIQGVEWDAVELPSQLMENFCWEWSVLEQMTAHVDTGAPLPRAMFDRMLAAKNFQSGLATIRYLEFGLFDMLLHSAQDPRGGEAPQAVLDAVRREVAVAPRASYDRFMHSFAHIFAGGYAAGYYSYQWAEVLSADAYSAFEEAGVLSPAAGAKFRDEVLARGGSRDAHGVVRGVSGKGAPTRRASAA